MKKRLLAWFLTAAMLLTLLPAAALADEAETNPAEPEAAAYDDAYASAEEADTPENEVVAESGEESEAAELYEDTAADENAADDEDAETAVVVSSGTFGADGDNLTWSLDDAGTLTISGIGAMEDYTNDQQAPWYSARDSVKSVVINSGVTSIGHYAFDGCSSLTGITIPDEITSIGDYAFNGCTALTSVVLGGSGVSIGAYAFQNCTSMDVVSIPDSAVIGDCAFSGDAVSLTVTKDTGNIPDYFCACYDNSSSETINRIKGITNLVVEEGITSIGIYAFKGYNSHNYWRSSLKSIQLPESLQTVGAHAFAGNTSLEEADIGGLTEISSYMFDTCIKLKSIDLKNAVTIIGANAFASCNKLAQIQNANAVVSIEGYAFAWCYELTAVNFPAIANVGMYAFSSCTGLTTAALGTSGVNIRTYAFVKCTSLGAVTIPDSAVIGDYAFSGDAVALTVTKDTGSIPDYFCACYCDSSSNTRNKIAGIVSLVIEEGITSIGSYAFYVDTSYGTSSIQSLQLPESLETVGEYAFAYNTSLPEVKIGSVKTISTGMFEGCSALTTVSIPLATATIQSDAFSNCSSLTDVWYYGNESLWQKVSISESGNSTLLASNMHYIRTTACEHGYETYEISVTDPTCTEQGYTTYTCTVCGDSYVYDYVDAKGHTWGDGVVTTEATCGTPGVMTYTCTVCGETKEEPIIKDHTWAGTADGSTCTYTCSVCGKSYSVQMESGTVWRYGSCGTNAFYALSIYGAMYIFGYGSMTDFSSASDLPWYSVGVAVKSLHIDDAITSIGKRAFYNCSWLTEVDLPAVSSIGALAFYGCTRMTTATLGASGVEIGTRAFEKCTSLVDVSIPDSAVIGDCAFSGDAVSLTVTKDTGSIPDNFCTLSAGTPNYLRNFGIINLVVEEGITSIGRNAFYGYCFGSNSPYYSALQSVKLPESLETVGENAFAYNTKLTEVEIGGLTEIESHTFYNCSALESIDLKDAVTKVGDSAFDGCTSLTDVTVPDSATSIGAYAFHNCSGLTSVTIGRGVATIGDYAFDSCTTLSDVYYTGKESEWNAITIGINNEALTNAALHCKHIVLASGTCGDALTWTVDDESTLTISGTGAMTDFASASVIPWADYKSNFSNVIIEPGVTSIGKNAFYKCTNIITVTIPDSVTSIGSYAFCGCTGLKQAAIPAGVSSIASYSFNGCTGLTGVTMQEGIASIDMYAFWGCSSLKRLTIPDSVTTIGNCAFTLSGLTGITIPAGVTSIGSSVFDTCSNLQAIQVSPDNAYFCSVDGILYNKDCTAIKCVPEGIQGSVTIPEGVTVIGGFSGCGSLTGVTIPESAVKISTYAFYCCSNLTEIVIPDGVTTIGDSAFRMCNNLKNIVIPDSVRTIEENAFSGCRGLADEDGLVIVRDVVYDYYGNTNTVVIPDGVTEITDYVFRGESMTSVTLTSSVTKIGAYAFWNCSHLTDVYFCGTEEQWNSVKMDIKNDPLTNAEIHYIEDITLRIVTQPDGGEATIGQTVTISFEAANAKSYQWYYSNDAGETWTKLYWDGAKTDTLSVNYIASRSAFLYRCCVTGIDGTTVYTEPTMITQGIAPEVVINRQPQTVCADIGETVSFTIDADNAVTYQWYYSKDNGTTWTKLYWDGYTTDTLTFEVKKSRYSYVYYCKMTDGNGSSYYSKRCYLRQHFSLKTQPQDVSASIGSTANLTVSAVGVESYQWYYSSDNGESWKKLSWTGAKSDTLTVNVTQTRCSYVYHCVLTGYDGTAVTTNNVKITAAD